jgi:hypothetical protein
MNANTTMAIVDMVWGCIIPSPFRDEVCRQCRSRSASSDMLVKECAQREGTSYPVLPCLSSTSAHRMASCSAWLRQPRRAEGATRAVGTVWLLAGRGGHDLYAVFVEDIQDVLV